MSIITPYPGNTDWPDNIQGCTITGRYIDVLGTPIEGKVHFTPAPAALLNASADVIVVSKRITATLDEDGAFSITVPATDDPDVNPIDWTYTVSEDFMGGRTYPISAPQNTTVDLADVSPVPNSAGTAIVVGPKGDKGDPGSDGGGGGATSLWLPVMNGAAVGSGFTSSHTAKMLAGSGTGEAETIPAYNASMTTVDVYALMIGESGPGHTGNQVLALYYHSKDPADEWASNYYNSLAGVTVASSGSGYFRRFKIASGLSISAGNLFSARLRRFGDDAADTATAGNALLGILVVPAA